MATNSKKKRKRTVLFEKIPEPDCYNSDEDFISNDEMSGSSVADSSFSENEISDAETSDSERGSLMDIEGTNELRTGDGIQWENGVEHDINHITHTHYSPTHHAENVTSILGELCSKEPFNNGHPRDWLNVAAINRLIVI